MLYSIVFVASHNHSISTFQFEKDIGWLKIESKVCLILHLWQVSAKNKLPSEHFTAAVAGVDEEKVEAHTQGTTDKRGDWHQKIQDWNRLTYTPQEMESTVGTVEQWKCLPDSLVQESRMKYAGEKDKAKTQASPEGGHQKRCLTKNGQRSCLISRSKTLLTIGTVW